MKCNLSLFHFLFTFIFSFIFYPKIISADTSYAANVLWDPKNSGSWSSFLPKNSKTLSKPASAACINFNGINDVKDDSSVSYFNSLKVINETFRSQSSSISLPSFSPLSPSLPSTPRDNTEPLGDGKKESYFIFFRLLFFLPNWSFFFNSVDFYTTFSLSL